MKKQKKKDYTVPVITIVGLFVLTLMLNVAVTPYETDTPSTIATTNNPAQYAGRSHVVAIDQYATNKVMILSSSLYKNGFIIIRKVEKEAPGRIIGQTALLSPGLYQNRYIPLNEAVWTDDELYLSIVTDNGDGLLSLPDDKKQEGDKEEPAMSSLYVL